jgi:hypothetical protein
MLKHVTFATPLTQIMSNKPRTTIEDSSLALSPRSLLDQTSILVTPCCSSHSFLGHLQFMNMVMLDTVTDHDWFSPSNQPTTTEGYVADANPCYAGNNMEEPETGSGSIHRITAEVNLEAGDTVILNHHATHIVAETELQIDTPILTLLLH